MNAVFSEKAIDAASRPRSELLLELIGVTKVFENFVAVAPTDLRVMAGEFFTIVGPSGSGKTTLLRMLAGMEVPSGGDILLRGERLNDMPANRRPTCLVFQSLALFPHKSVGQNIEFALKMKGIDAATRKARALDLMRMVRLPESYYGKNVMKCSGGERQRVALARAFAYDPEILLFDEPLSAIDYKLRKTLEKELKDLHRETGKTFLYITHSLEEAMVMSDRIGVMRAGSVVQVGTPEEIYSRPSNRFVAEFMGEVNTIDVNPIGPGLFQGVDLPGIFKAPPGAPQVPGTLVIRPEFLRLIATAGETDNHVTGTVYNEYSLGSRMQYQVRTQTKTLLVEQPRRRLPAQGMALVGWNAADAIFVTD
ncbi:ABC transporter ATP-binding protein [Oleomonas cavernae]|uniref:ABC transporter ATP-binding protein n=1 Tax=Oleomonas cavernae TaxID=2320859 RepID=A0A418WEH5_9PROT|nr:ABC transporter ATP-binding protein [Oleomonas cavernae]RJF88349.1 ABC transporter ATP-binding protein [Oleomonas cavernae]